MAAKFYGNLQQLKDRLLPLKIAGEWQEQPNRVWKFKCRDKAGWWGHPNRSIGKNDREGRAKFIRYQLATPDDIGYLKADGTADAKARARQT